MLKFDHVLDTQALLNAPGITPSAPSRRAAIKLSLGAGYAVWAAAGFDDTDLSFLSFLELYGTEIAERRMPARRVVEALDVVEHI